MPPKKKMQPVKPENPQSEFVATETLTNGIKDFDVESLPDGFFAMVVAPRRSGKSEKIQSLLDSIYSSSKKFDHVFLFSETNSGYEGQIPQTYRFREMSHLPYVLNKQAEVKNWNKKQTKKEKLVKSRILIVLDDVIGETSGQNSMRSNSMIRKLSVNGRHLGNDGVPGNGVSVILITQAAKAIPKTIRMNTDIIMIGRISNRVERQTIIEEFTTLKSDREGIKAAYNNFDEITLSKPYRFMVISNHIANKSSESDYIHYFDGTYPVKQRRLFGDSYDWSAEETITNLF